MGGEEPIAADNRIRDLKHLIENHLDDRPVGLPGHVASALGVESEGSVGSFLSATQGWFRARSDETVEREGAEEVVYEAYLGPFLGFDGELGTLCSLLCHVPYFVKSLSVTSILLLPILARGATAQKGKTGSPFAVADHAKLDGSIGGFAESVSIERVWEAVVTACESVGLSVGMICPTATVSIDSEAIRNCPELVYWWKSPPGTILTGTPVTAATQDGREHAWNRESVPAAGVRHLFTAAPGPDSIKRVSAAPGEYWVGSLDDGDSVTPANAYPDPVVSSDPRHSWRDVAAIRFDESFYPRAYRHAERMLQPNDAARNFVAEAIGFRLEKDGGLVQLDVSSAVPARVIEEARSRTNKPSRIIAEELWSFESTLPVDIVTGPLIPCVAAHSRETSTLVESLVYHLNLLANTTDVKPFFAGISNHDSVMTVGPIGRSLLALFVMLPGSIPFLYSGTEFENKRPTNEEFGVRTGGVRSEDDLLLFSQKPIRARKCETLEFLEYWQRLLRLRKSLGCHRVPTSSIHAISTSESLVSWRIENVEFAVNCDITTSATFRASEDAAMWSRPRSVLGGRVEMTRPGEIVLSPGASFLAADELPHRRERFELLAST